MHKINPRIQKLSSELANHIAAGEVVERPSSVLKELLENSLDAKSTQIQIYIEGGGLRCIRVEDNGQGICKEDSELAVLQHATSKVFTLSDLEGVISFGFRGEALASISSVSRFKLISSVSEQDMGWGIELEGRPKGDLEIHAKLFPQPKRQGTSVEVRDLFYNTPARRKFLRSEKTELLHLEETFKRIALSEPSVGFNLFFGDKLYKRLLACKTHDACERRIAQLCGEKFIQNANHFEAESNGLKLRGWLGSPDTQRAQADLQYFYVNGRIIRDKVINHAIREGYKDFCLPGRFPAYVLYFELDPRSVDVNVHPTKHEVRFRESKTVHSFISYAIQEALNQPKAIEEISITLNSPIGEEKQLSLQKNETIDHLEIARTYNHIPTQPSLYGKPFAILGGSLLLTKNDMNNVESPDEKKNQNFEGICIFDLKATHYHLTLAYLKQQYHLDSIPSQRLFMPKQMMVGRELAQYIGLFAEKADTDSFDLSIDWKKLGFDFSQVGPDIILIRAVPTLLKIDNKIENFDEIFSNFIKKLLNIRSIDLCTECLAEFINQYNIHTLEDSEALLKKFEASNLKEAAQSLKLYRRITIEQLKAALF